MEPLVAKIVYLVGYWLANFVIRAPYIRAHGRLPIRANHNTRADTVLFFAVSAGGFFIPLFYIFTPLLSFADYDIPRWIGLTGVGVLVVANWVFWKSHKDLGGNWSPRLELREHHRLVTTGIYRRIRHPMYLSLWLLVVAQAMILPNYVAGFSGLLPFAVLYFFRVGQEEAMMREHFGVAYDEYRKNSGRLLPKFGAQVSGKMRIVLVVGIFVFAATGCAQGASNQAPGATPPAEKHSAAVIEFPRQTLVFKPTRDDLTVGRVVFSVYCSKAADVRVNGVKPDPAWNEIHLTPAGEIVVDNRNRIAPANGAVWLYIYLTPVATNQFELPPLKLEFPTNAPSGQLCLSVKVWFNEVSNQYDSMYYQNLDDRYALVSFCTSAPERSGVSSRFKQNRVATVDEFKQALGKPFVLKLKPTPLRKEWTP